MAEENEVGVMRIRGQKAGVGDMKMRATRQGGFSMIELMVAMTVTLVVSGAIFGLLTAGQNAFRREPELADRQQSIRVAMDLIMRDVQTAGGGMDPFVQAFTRTDPGGTLLNNPPPAMGSEPSLLVPGERADFLEIMGNDGRCPTLTACGTPGVNIFTNEVPPACFQIPGLAYVYGSTGSAPNNPGSQPGVIWIKPPGGGGGGPCGGHVNAPPGQSWRNPTGGQACNPATSCQFIANIQVVRYELAPDPNDPTTPALWRSPTGRSDLADTLNNNPPPNAPWQLVARGIEDLQVRYLTGAGWNDDPGVVTAGNFGTIVREVQVTLSARSLAPNLAGQTTSAVGSAVRGQLVSVVSPRSALLNLDQNGSWK